MGGTPVYRWQDAVTKYINHHLHNRTIDEDKRYYKWLEPYLLDKLLDAGLPNGINSEVIEGIKEAKLSEGVSNLTVNRLLEIVRKTLYYAKTIKMVVDVVAIEMLPYKKRAKRWETEDNMNKLLQDLIEHKADHIHEMVDFTLETGLRESNVTGFQKSWVDFNLRQATIPADESKNQDEITIPLSDRAIVIIRRNWNNKHPTHVFTYKGKEPKDPTSDAYKRWKERKPMPVNKAGTTAFTNALTRVKIKNFRWHDLRHTWATWHVAAGTPLRDLMALGGWKDIESVMCYAHVDTKHLRQYVNRRRLTVISSRKSVTP